MIEVVLMVFAVTSKKPTAISRKASLGFLRKNKLFKSTINYYEHNAVYVDLSFSVAINLDNMTDFNLLHEDFNVET